MKVLLRRNIAKVGQIGDLVEVRAGYARNYLLPQGLATQPTEANIRAVEAEKERYLAEVARQRADQEARAAAVEGKTVTLAARANEEGHLYGSVGPAQVVAELADQGIFLEPANVALDPPIREVGEYDVAVRFDEDISATIHVSVASTEPPADEEPAQTGEAPAVGAPEPAPEPAGDEKAPSPAPGADA
jgi:large subunit ribosomal protein L9